MIRALSLAIVIALGGCVLAGKHTAQAPKLAKNAASQSYELVHNTWLRVRDSGDAAAHNAPPILLVHGYGSRLETWDLVQPELAKRTRVVSYDQRGFGKSERPGGKYGPAVHAKDLATLADKMKLNKPILVGHSYGGGVALRAALDHPDRFSGLVLVDAFALEEQLPPAFKWAKVPGLGEFIFATQFKEVVGEKYILAFSDRKRFATPQTISEFRNNMLEDGAMYAALHTVRGMSYAQDQRRYHTLRMPTVVVWGEDDRVTPLSDGKKLVGHIDNARLEVLAACGHVPPWERPQALVAIIERMIDDVTRSVSP